MKRILLTVESITYAMKARKLLNSQGISATVIKNDGAKNEGCRYGVEISSGEMMEAAKIMRENGIKYTVKG